MMPKKRDIPAFNILKYDAKKLRHLNEAQVRA